MENDKEENSQIEYNDKTHHVIENNKETNNFTREDLDNFINKHKDMKNFDILQDLTTSIFNIAEKNRINENDSEEVIKEKKANDEMFRFGVKVLELKERML